jgi:hypothetical protein
VQTIPLGPLFGELVNWSPEFRKCRGRDSPWAGQFQRLILVRIPASFSNNPTDHTLPIRLGFGNRGAGNCSPERFLRRELDHTMDQGLRWVVAEIDGRNRCGESSISRGACELVYGARDGRVRGFR